MQCVTEMNMIHDTVEFVIQYNVFADTPSQKPPHFWKAIHRRDQAVFSGPECSRRISIIILHRR